MPSTKPENVVIRLCPECGGREHPAFDCHRFVTWTDENGVFRVATFKTKREAREFADRMNRKNGHRVKP